MYPWHNKSYIVIILSQETILTNISFLLGKEKLSYPTEKPVYVVLEEDGTEVDEEEYFQTLPENTLLMLLYVGDKWSPYGLPFK